MDTDCFNGNFAGYNLGFDFNKMRRFPSGAIRDNDGLKLDIEGAICPMCLKIYGEYMKKHSILPDGTFRSTDNWQKGFGIANTIKSLIRHVHTAWLHLRGYNTDESITDTLSAVIFNAQSILHEIHKNK